jgi:hypothetical protein
VKGSKTVSSHFRIQRWEVHVIEDMQINQKKIIELFFVEVWQDEKL